MRVNRCGEAFSPSRHRWTMTLLMIWGRCEGRGDIDYERGADIYIIVFLYTRQDKVDSDQKQRVLHKCTSLQLWRFTFLP